MSTISRFIKTVNWMLMEIHISNKDFVTDHCQSGWNASEPPSVCFSHLNVPREIYHNIIFVPYLDTT